MDDRNKRHHVFGNPDHNLDALVAQYGNEEAAGLAIIEAVNETYRAGALILDPQGRFRQVIDVGGNSVTVAGRIVNGVIRLGSAWIRPAAARNRDG